MQAEVTGKLKQHFNNALPKQNSTTTGVSVIMVSGVQSSALEHWGHLAWLLSWSCLLSQTARGLLMEAAVFHVPVSVGGSAGM